MLIAGAVLFAKYLIDNKEKPKPKFDKVVKTVYVKDIQNTTVPIRIQSNGNLEAKYKVALFSEVQGVLETTHKEFKPGTRFSKGQTLLKINSDEFRANLQSQKSNLFNLITAVMPDIQLDYASEYQKWKAYLESFDIQKPIKELPKTISDKEKFFISGRGIVSAYYNVKNLEVKYNKFVLKAPFSGILTEASVNPGTLIRPGQKLGEFIDPNIYEVAVSVKSEFRDLLEVGKNVELFNLEQTNSWTGKVVRVNGKVDQQTQTIEAFIEVWGTDLKEGLYMEITLEARAEEQAYEVDRVLLVDESKLFIVKDSVLDLIEIEPVFENKNTLVVKGLPDGTKLLSKPVPGAHPGMLVKIFSDKNNKR
jgi:multidrug efflux pump subunit AcrA (membrane-fusion protein)